MFLEKKEPEVIEKEEIIIDGLDIHKGIIASDKSEALYKETLKEFIVAYKDMITLMPKWIEQDLLEVAGMSTNPINPGQKFAQRILNAHVHERPGALVIRPGYDLKYSAPLDPTITDDEFLNFETFFDHVRNTWEVPDFDFLCRIALEGSQSLS